MSLFPRWQSTLPVGRIMIRRATATTPLCYAIDRFLRHRNSWLQCLRVKIQQFGVLVQHTASNLTYERPRFGQELEYMIISVNQLDMGQGVAFRSSCTDSDIVTVYVCEVWSWINTALHDTASCVWSVQDKSNLHPELVPIGDTSHEIVESEASHRSSIVTQVLSESLSRYFGTTFTIVVKINVILAATVGSRYVIASTQRCSLTRNPNRHYPKDHRTPRNGIHVVKD